MDIDFAYKRSNYTMYEGRNSFNFPNEKTKMPSRSAVLLVALLATTLGLCRHSLAQSSAGIFLMPTSNQTVPSNSFDNVTYNCEVDAHRILIWEANMIPLEDIDSVREFEAIGVFKVDQGTNRSTLIITRDAREEYSWQPISVRCSAFTRMPLQSDHSSFSYVITQYDRIFFTPTSNQTVSSNSLDNVTYNCEVDGNQILIWEVNMITLEDIDNVGDFEAIGVFKVDQGTNRSTLIITRDAREEYSWQPISVRCSAFTRMPPQSDYSSFSYVITQYVVDCGALNNSVNGSIHYTTGTTFGQRVNYSCNTGYNLMGDSTRICQATGVWSGSAPTCQAVDCGNLTDPANGHVSHTAGTTFGQTATYSCNAGYNMVGDNTRTCLATGNWSGSVPTCQAVNCGNLTNPANGQVAHTAGTTFGQTTTYSCNAGYDLVGDSNRTCQAIGDWSGSAPTCQVVDCGSLNDPANGRVSHTAGTTFEQTATYSCNTGYNQVGGSTRTCQASGAWSGSAPTCQAVDCGNLSDPANGQVSHTVGTTFGQTATYSCNAGYNMVGDSTRTCLATGNWSGSAPTCQAVNCGNLTNPANGQVAHTAGTTFGQTATYSCNAGYYLVGESNRTCQATGNWSESAPTCQVVDCGPLNDPANGRVSHTAGTTFEQTATYSCNTGYNLLGDSTRTCQATGNWSESAPTCQVVDCGTLNDPANGRVSHTPGTTFEQTATYNCNTGYNLVGSSTRTCQASGAWSGSAPTCQAVDCGNLTDPVNGHVSHTAGTTFGQTATYSCNTGYNMVGDNTHTCLATKNWSGSAPTCQAVNCGNLTNPANGQVAHTAGTTFGQTATYSCNAGYDLVGSSNHTCQATGNWSESVPTCQVVDCGTLNDPANGRVSHTAGTTFEQTATYSCNTGYNLVGSSTRTCQASGAWSGSAPTCQAVDCGNLTDPANSHISHTAGTTFGQTATYSCNTGYNMVGDNTHTCLATGNWSGSAPTCQAVNCGNLTNPANGQVAHTAGITFGQTATYSCNAGYDLVGSSNRTCQATGDWSESAPTCQVVDCGTLNDPANGRVSHTAGTTFEQTATYSCNTGYNLVGGSTRTCQASGAWSGNAPTCEVPVTTTEGVGTSDKRLSTGHIIGISFGILGLVVPIIMSVSILLVRYYIQNHHVKKKQKPNLLIINFMAAEQRRASGFAEQEVVQICMVDESQQYDCISQAAQTAQRTHSS